MVLTGRLHMIPELYPISLIPVPGVRLKVDMHSGEPAGQLCLKPSLCPPVGGSSSHWGHGLRLGKPEAGYWPGTLYRIWTWGEYCAFEPGPSGLWALSCSLAQLCVAGVEVPEVIKNFCRRASYISQEKLW